jgi:hypothetical protein
LNSIRPPPCAGALRANRDGGYTAAVFVGVEAGLCAPPQLLERPERVCVAVRVRVHDPGQAAVRATRGHPPRVAVLALDAEHVLWLARLQDPACRHG